MSAPKLHRFLPKLLKLAKKGQKESKREKKDEIVCTRLLGPWGIQKFATDFLPTSTRNELEIRARSAIAVQSHPRHFPTKLTPGCLGGDFSQQMVENRGIVFCCCLLLFFVLIIWISYPFLFHLNVDSLHSFYSPSYYSFFCILDDLNRIAAVFLKQIKLCQSP